MAGSDSGGFFGGKGPRSRLCSGTKAFITRMVGA